MAKAKSFTTCLYSEKRYTVLSYKASVLNDLCIELGIDTSDLKGTYSIIETDVEHCIPTFNDHLLYL